MTGFCAELLPHEREIADLAGVEAPLDGLRPSFADPRVDVGVALAPRQVFGREGLLTVDVPVMYMAGSADDTCPLEGVDYIYDHIRSTENTPSSSGTPGMVCS